MSLPGFGGNLPGEMGGFPGMELPGLGGAGARFTAGDIEARTHRLKTTNATDVARAIEKALPNAKTLKVVPESTSNMIIIVADTATMKDVLRIIEEHEGKAAPGGGSGRAPAGGPGVGAPGGSGRPRPAGSVPGRPGAGVEETGDRGRTVTAGGRWTGGIGPMIGGGARDSRLKIFVQAAEAGTAAGHGTAVPNRGIHRRGAPESTDRPWDSECHAEVASCSRGSTWNCPGAEHSARQA